MGGAIRRFTSAAMEERGERTTDKGMGFIQLDYP